jgi:hypothetical protein
MKRDKIMTSNVENPEPKAESKAFTIAQKILKQVIIQNGVRYMIPVMIDYLSDLVKPENVEKLKPLRKHLESLRDELDEVITKIPDDEAETET